MTCLRNHITRTLSASMVSNYYYLDALLILLVIASCSASCCIFSLASDSHSLLKISHQDLIVSFYSANLAIWDVKHSLSIFTAIKLMLMLFVYFNYSLRAQYHARINISIRFNSNICISICICIVINILLRMLPYQS